MKHIKLFFVCMLTTILGIGQVWGVTENRKVTLVFTTNGGTNSGSLQDSTCYFSSSTAGFSGSVTNIVDITTAKNDAGTAPTIYAEGLRFYKKKNSANGGSITLTAGSSVKAITKVKVTGVSNYQRTVSYKVDGGSATAFGSWSNDTVSTGTILASESVYIQVTENSNNTNQLRVSRIEISYTAEVSGGGGGGGDDKPTISVKQGTTAIETLTVPAAGVASPGSTLTLEYANIKANSEGANPAIAFYSNATCTTSTTPAWFSATGTNKTTVTYTAQANNSGSTRTVYAVISNTVKNSSNADATVTDTITISQATLVLVTSVSVKESTSLEVGATETLTATVKPDDASDKSVEWSSDATSVATVDENGKVTAVAIGTANITATAKDGSGKKGTCAVTVTKAFPKIIIDGSKLSSDATSNVSTIKYGNVQEDSIDVVFSDGAKYYTSNSSQNHFGNTKAIFIGKTGKYIYNSSPLPGDIKKFELYANYGASANVQVSVTFSRYPLTEAASAGDTLYTAALSTLDSVYDCSAKIPIGAKYFYYKVTNNYNSQVQFRITYEPPVESAVTFTAEPSNGIVVVKNGNTALTSGDKIEAGTTLTIIPTANTGYILDGAPTVNSGAVTVTGPVNGEYTFTMPEEAAAIVVAFKQGIPAPEMDEQAGTYDDTLLVTINNYSDDYMYFYTIDGTDPAADTNLDPTGNSAVYDKDNGIEIAKNCTLKVIGYDLEHNASDITSVAYKIRFTQPTITTTAVPVNDTYTSAINVTITATGADAIYYNVDSNDDPTTSSTPYNGAIELSTTGSHTIKALAVKDGYANSNVASKTFVLDLPFTTIKSFIDAAPSTAKSLVLTDAFISGIDGTTMYIQDATAGIMIYGLSALPENAAPNHSISGTIVGKYTAYKKQHELVKPDNSTPIVLSNVTISSETVSRPTINSYTSLTDAYAADSMKLVTLTGVNYVSNTPNNTQKNIYAMFGGNKIYNTFLVFSGATVWPETDKTFSITGVVVNFDGTMELLPVFASDIITTATPAAPTFNPEGGANDANAVTTAAVTVTPADNTKVNGSSDDVVVDINSEIPAEVEVTVTRDFYTSTTVSGGWYKAAASKYKVNGQGATTEATIIAKVDNVTAETAAAGDEVHILINLNNHFHLAVQDPITVNGNSGSVTVTEVTANSEYKFTMPAEEVTIAVSYIEDAKTTVKFAMGTQSATGTVPSNMANKYKDDVITLPGNPFTYTGSPIKAFGGWKHSLTNDTIQPGSYTITTADVAEEDITFTATWVDLSPWATVYGSNITLAGNADTKAYAEKVKITVEEVLTEFGALRACTSNAAGSCNITIPAGTTKLHFHAVAWKNKTSTVTISMGETELLEQSLKADDGINTGSPYTLAGNAYEYYYSIDFSSYSLTKDTVITFSAGSDQRFVLFGVNAVYPAAITLDPTSKDFGEVKENASAQQEFTITPNAMSTGDLVASIIGTDAAKFSVGDISENKVTVTFTPGEIGGPYSASLKIESGNAEVTAALSGTGITSATPEIGIDKDAVAFGNVVQNSTPGTESVAVTLSNIDENGVSAVITGSAFTIAPAKLTANGSIVITPVTTTPGEYSETLTLSATGATSKEVTITMTVVDQWAYEYESNVTVGAEEYTIQILKSGSTTEYDEFEGQRYGSGSDHGVATIKVPANTQTLHFHAAGWNNESVQLTVTMSDGSITLFQMTGTNYLVKESDVSGTKKTYKIATPVEEYYSIDLSQQTIGQDEEIKFTATAGNRFVLFGVNQEGGILPELQSIAISGDLDNKTYKAGDELDMTGLTVSATYTLGGVPQTPVDITNNEKLQWSYEPLVKDQISVEVTATFEGETATKTIEGLEVASADPKISVDKDAIAFGKVEQNEVVESQTISVTLTNVEAASVSISGTGASAFNFNPSALTASGTINVTPITTTVGTFNATLTISDDANGAEDVTVALSIRVKAIRNCDATDDFSTATNANPTNYTTRTTSAGWSAVNAAYKADETNDITFLVINGKTTATGVITSPVIYGGIGNLSLSYANFNSESNGVSFKVDIKQDDEVKKTETITKANKDVTQSEVYSTSIENINLEGAFQIVITNLSPSNNTGNKDRLAIGEICWTKYGSYTEIDLENIEASEVSATNLPKNIDVTVPENKTLIVDNPKTFGNVTIQAGGHVNITSGKLTVNKFSIETKMGSGKSGQLFGGTASNIEATDEAYIDIELGIDITKNDYEIPGGGTIDGSTKAANQWHAFTVPFPVDALNGVYNAATNTKLTNEEDYAIMDFNGALRAQGKFAWKKVRGTLVPGTFYLLTVNGDIQTYRFKKKENAALVADNTKELFEFPKTTEDNDNGWNAVGNPTLRYGKVDYQAQVLNPISYTYEAYTAQSTNFVVGTPFFIQADKDAAQAGMTMLAAEGNANYAPSPVTTNEIKDVQINFGDTHYIDRLYISANEEAKNEYEIGKDLVKMTMNEAPQVAQIYAKAYKDNLCIVNAPLINDRAEYALSLYAPVAGEYTLSTPELDNANVYLTKDGVIIWILSLNPYTVNLAQGNTEGYGLLVYLKSPQVETNIENGVGISADCTAQKIIIDHNVYILRNGQLYDVTGKSIK